ncbi:MAG: hypothetical protein AAF790_14700, partial [Planctomycetota bacterium]
MRPHPSHRRSLRRVGRLAWRGLAWAALAVAVAGGGVAWCQPPPVSDAALNATPDATPNGASDAPPAATPAKEPAAGPTPAPAASAPADQAAGPDTTIWIDDQGVPRPVVGMSYEELAKAYRVLQGLDGGDTQPRFVRQKLVATGRVIGERVELSLRCDVLLAAAGRVAAPVGFSGAILDAPPRIQGGAADQQFVTYDAQRGGYVAWLAGRPGERRTVELSLTCRLRRDGTSTLLRTNLPRANQSEVAVTVPADVAEPFASPGGVLDAAPLP